MAEDRISIFQRLMTLFLTQSVPWYLKDQPPVIQNFIKHFGAVNFQEQALFKEMMTNVKRHGVSLDNQHHLLAQLGDEAVLRHLHEQYRGQDTRVCKYIAGNPNCPTELVKEYMHVPDFEIRQAAAQNPQLTDTYCIDFARHEADPHVQAALKARLGDRYPFYNFGSNIFAVEEFIGRCFNRNLNQDGPVIDMEPILAAYRWVDLMPLSSNAVRNMHEAVVGIADGPLLQSLYYQYQTDPDMLNRISKNENCSTDLKEKIQSMLSTADKTQSVSEKSSLDSLIADAARRSTTHVSKGIYHEPLSER